MTYCTCSHCTPPTDPTAQRALDMASRLFRVTAIDSAMKIQQSVPSTEQGTFVAGLARHVIDAANNTEWCEAQFRGLVEDLTAATQDMLHRPITTAPTSSRFPVEWLSQ